MITFPVAELPGDSLWSLASVLCGLCPLSYWVQVVDKCLCHKCTGSVFMSTHVVNDPFICLCWTTDSLVGNWRAGGGREIGRGETEKAGEIEREGDIYIEKKRETGEEK